MRGLFYPVLILIVILAVGSVWLLVHPPSWWADMVATVSSVTGTSPNGTSPTPAKASDKPTPFEAKKMRHSGNAGTTTVAIKENVPTPDGPLSTERHYPFPLAEDIRTGTVRAVLSARFGPPAAVVTGADVGQLRERFVYIDKATGRKTFIFLINGNVASAETNTQ